MQTLKNAGTFTVTDLTVNPIVKIAQKARISRQTDADKGKTDEEMVKLILLLEHGACLEFADMTVDFDLVCRGMTHELVRHRLSSFLQESTRYVDESNLKVVVPPHKDESEQYTIDGEGTLSLADWFELNEKMYRALIKAKWKPEDARQTLPIATKSQISIKANFRQWRLVFQMRCDLYAHWEIKGAMLRLLSWCKRSIPLIFDDFCFFSEANKSFSKYTLNAEECSPEYITKNKIYARQICSGRKINGLLNDYLKANNLKIDDLQIR